MARRRISVERMPGQGAPPAVADQAEVRPQGLLGRPADLAFDATTVKEPGKTGALWRIHWSVCLPSLACDFFMLTPTEGPGTGESLVQFPDPRPRFGDAARPLVHDPELRQRSPCIGEAIPGPRPGARRPGVGREGLHRAGRRRARRRHSRLGRQGVVRLHSSHLRHPRHGGARPELGPGAAALRPGRDSPGGGLRRTGSGGRCTGRRAGRARRQGEAVRLARTGRHRATGIGRGGGGLDSGRELVALPEAVIRHAAVRRVRVGPLDLLPRRRRSVDPG